LAADSAPSPVTAGGGVFHARVIGSIVNHVDGLVWFEDRESSRETLEMQWKSAGKQKPRRLVERAGFSKTSMISFRS
jgi:hypothetical protein